MIRILLADDHKPVRRAIRTLLQSSAGLEVVGEAGNGQEAISLAKRLRPEIVVMDVLMPKVNGLEAAKKIREFVPQTKVIFLSIYSEFSLVQEALFAGGMAYVLKQESAYDLIEAIRAAIAKKPYLSPKLQDLPLPSPLAERVESE
jgi:DNA-binding NarL/FixJ family response regulator